MIENTTKLYPGPTIQSRPCRPQAGFGLVKKNIAQQCLFLVPCLGGSHLVTVGQVLVYLFIFVDVRLDLKTGENIRDGVDKNPFCLRRSNPWSIILTATAAMAGGTQLFEGAHLTSGNTRFCRESSKRHNYALFVGQIIKYALQIILGFGSNVPFSNKESDSNVPLHFFVI